MKAKEFLDQLNPQSVVFEENICYEYTERQLILFAELYQKHIAKNNEVLDLVSGCYYLVKLMSDDEFEPALVVFIGSENAQCFQFLNGVTVLCSSVNEYKEISYR